MLKESVLSSVPGSSEKYRVTEYEYDALNRVTKSTVNGSSTTYEYDKVGNMTKSTTASGSVSYEYDQLNRVKKYTDALGKSETYTYSNAGDMTSKKDRNGLTTSYTYDALHRLTKESVTKDGKTNTNTYTYALTGQLVNESNGSTAKTYKYYKQGTAINDDESVTIDGISYRTKRVYDKNDNVMETFTYKGGAGEEMYSNVYVYDSKGRLSNYRGRSVTDTDVNNAYNVFYTYDKNDNITNVSVSDNNKKNVKLTSAYSYNNANMLTSLVNKNGSGTTLSSYSYSYNLDGNINKKTETGKTTTYTYDGANRLTGENITKSGKNTNMSYTYDGAGNRLSLTVSGSENYVTTYNYDANNRLIKSSKKNSGASYSDVMYYSYDNNGNQTRIDKAREANAGKMKLGIYSANENSGYGYEFFTYDGLNQLIKYGDEKNNTASYEYLSNGLRLSKTVKGEKTSFIWDGNNIQFTISSDETVSYSRVPGYMRASSTKAMESSAPAMQRDCTLYLYNGHGDVTGTTNKDGNIKKTYDYDAFGNEISPDSSDTNPFRYCGEYYDSETESIYLRARYYNMGTGRFISEDPIKDGLNWYAYCGGNPVMFWDPSGLEYNSLRTLVKSTADALGCGYEIKTDDKNNKVTVTIGAGTYDISGTFYYDGTAEMNSVSAKEKIAVNDNGTLKMERSDFYSAMGIQNESSMITEKNRGIVKVALSLSVGVVSGAITSVFIVNVYTGIVVGAIVGEVSAKIIDCIIEDPGDYLKITTVGEVYNKKTGLYESIVTKDDYKLGPYNGEYAYNRERLTTEKDDYTYVTSIFDNTVY